MFQLAIRFLLLYLYLYILAIQLIQGRFLKRVDRIRISPLISKVDFTGVSRRLSIHWRG